MAAASTVRAHQVLRLPGCWDVRLARQGPGEHLHLEGQSVEEVVDPLSCLVDDEALAELRVLGRDADRTAAGVAVVAAACRDRRSSPRSR